MEDMMNISYTDEKNILILITLLKAHGIKKSNCITRHYKYYFC